MESNRRLPDRQMDEHAGGGAPGTRRAAQKVTRKVKESPRQWERVCRVCVCRAWHFSPNLRTDQPLKQQRGNLRLIWWLPAIISPPLIRFFPSYLSESWRPSVHTLSDGEHGFRSVSVSQPSLCGLMSDGPRGHKTHFLFNQRVETLQLRDRIK